MVGITLSARDTMIRKSRYNPTSYCLQSRVRSRQSNNCINKGKISTECNIAFIHIVHQNTVPVLCFKNMSSF